MSAPKLPHAFAPVAPNERSAVRARLHVESEFPRFSERLEETSRRSLLATVRVTTRVPEPEDDPSQRTAVVRDPQTDEQELASRLRLVAEAGERAGTAREAAVLAHCAAYARVAAATRGCEILLVVESTAGWAARVRLVAAAPGGERALVDVVLEGLTLRAFFEVASSDPEGIAPLSDLAWTEVGVTMRAKGVLSHGRLPAGLEIDVDVEL